MGGLKIGAVILAHNMAPLIQAAVWALNWTDGIFLFDDHSDDGTAEVARQAARVPLVVEPSELPKLAFAFGELTVRNYICQRAFETLGLDVVCVVDADELLLGTIRPVIEQKVNEGYSAVSMSTWHLTDAQTYLRFRETTINGLVQVDPHVRIFTAKRSYSPLRADESHPIVKADRETWHTHGPYHFHLKYLRGSPYPNSSLANLPERPSAADIDPFSAHLPFKTPAEVATALDLMDWPAGTDSSSRPRYGTHRMLVSRRETCLAFTGCQPCDAQRHSGFVCDTCPDFRAAGQSILCLLFGDDIWFESALGSALATARHYPGARLFCVCDEGHAERARITRAFHQVCTVGPEALALLLATRFDLTLSLSASPLSAQLGTLAVARVKRGLIWSADGRVTAANLAAVGLLQHLAFPTSSPMVTESASLSSLIAEACEEAAP
jgi:hypothetical protein